MGSSSVGIQNTDGYTYGNVTTYGIGQNGWNGYDIENRWTWMGRVAYDQVGLHDNSAYSWIFRVVSGTFEVRRPMLCTSLVTLNNDLTFTSTGFTNFAGGMNYSINGTTVGFMDAPTAANNMRWSSNTGNLILRSATNNLQIESQLTSFAIGQGSHVAINGGNAFNMTGSANVGTGCFLPTGFNLYKVYISTTGNSFGTSDQWFTEATVRYNITAYNGTVTNIAANNCYVSVQSFDGQIFCYCPGGSGTYPAWVSWQRVI